MKKLLGTQPQSGFSKCNGRDHQNNHVHLTIKSDGPRIKMTHKKTAKQIVNKAVQRSSDVVEATKVETETR